MALLLPLMTVECSTVEPPPFFGGNEAELRACAKAIMDNPASLTATVDGVTIPDLEQYRVQSPLFRFTLPADNWLGIPPITATAAADGYWIVLAPLPVGTHELRFGGSLPNVGLSTEAVYYLTVAAPAVMHYANGPQEIGTPTS